MRVRRRVVFAERYQVMRIAFAKVRSIFHYVKNSMTTVSRSRIRLGLASSAAWPFVRTLKPDRNVTYFALLRRRARKLVVHADEKLASHTCISTRKHNVDSVFETSHVAQEGMFVLY